jgi:ubiquinone/menaquinone biosynthesis C-methylase UbiE
MPATATKAKYFWKENFEEFDDEEADRYHFGVTQYPFNLKLYDKLIAELLQPIIDTKKSLKVLDAGGGTGKWSIYFSKRKHKVTLIDIAHPMLKVARKMVVDNGLENMITIHHGNIADLPYENKRFDFVFSDRNPISHCGPREKSYESIRELYRVMKNDARIVGCVLNKHRKVAQLTSELKFDQALDLMRTGDLPRGNGNCTHYYAASELMTILEDTGFHNISLLPTTAFTEMIPTAWLLDEIPLQKCLQLEIEGRKIPEVLSYGVRYHFMATK